MTVKSWKCLCCGKDLGDWSQNGAVVLQSHGGNDGSRVYDNMMGSQPTFVEAGICDPCFVDKVKDGAIRAFKREVVSQPPPYEVNWAPSIRVSRRK